MNTKSHLERAEKLLGHWSGSTTTILPNRIDIDITADDIVPVVATLIDGRWGYLVAITGLDPGVNTGKLWVLYHFAEGDAVVTLRVEVPRDQPAVPTIRHMISLAGIYEQELSEILGVNIIGSDFSGRLFLADDWPEYIYPLRKDFQTL